MLGGYGEFDMLAARIVNELKEKYSCIISILVIPYLDRKYDTTLYDCMEYPPIEAVPKRLAILKRNEFMVEKSEVIIAYVKNSFGGAAKTLKFAGKLGKVIYKL